VRTTHRAPAAGDCGAAQCRLCHRPGSCFCLAEQAGGNLASRLSEATQHSGPVGEQFLICRICAVQYPRCQSTTPILSLVPAAVSKD
jgi:hypothetical protein